MIDHPVHRSGTAQKPAPRHWNATLSQRTLRDRAKTPVELPMRDHGRHRSRRGHIVMLIGAAGFNEGNAQTRILRQPRSHYAAGRATTHHDKVEAMRFTHRDAASPPSTYRTCPRRAIRPRPLPGLVQLADCMRSPLLEDDEWRPAAHSI